MSGLKLEAIPDLLESLKLVPLLAPDLAAVGAADVTTIGAAALNVLAASVVLLGTRGDQWWLLPYEGSKRSWAQTALGYGGQFLFVVPEYELIAVFTGWNNGEPSLAAQIALEGVIDSVR